LTLVDDFRAKQSAIERAGWDDVFKRASLRAALGLVPLPQCCTATPAALADDEAQLGGIAAAFATTCGGCHRGADVSPPNFLAGDSGRIDAALRHCAPRIYVRLAMWEVPPAARAKVPMPPPRAALRGSPHEQLVADAAIGPLQTTVAGWLRSETGTVPTVDALLAGGYENLRACLPPSVTGEAR
jgi:mono/diheme cytochrome c family protein